MIDLKVNEHLYWIDKPYFGLKRGTKYTGRQTTIVGSFKIDMKVNVFSLSQGYICGTLTIHNLTSEYKLLITHFEGVLMSAKNISKAADEFKQWSKFSKWKKDFENQLLFNDSLNSECLYFKIKEEFLLPNHKLTRLHGASIDGHYYCCYFKKSDSFGGFYQASGSFKHSAQRILLVRTNEGISQSFAWA